MSAKVLRWKWASHVRRIAPETNWLECSDGGREWLWTRKGQREITESCRA